MKPPGLNSPNFLFKKKTTIRINSISKRLTKANNIDDRVKSKMVAEINAIQHSLSGVLEKTLSNSQINSNLIQIETTLNRFDKQTLLTEELTELLTKKESHQRVIEKDFDEEHRFNDLIEKISQIVLDMLEYVKLNQSNLDNFNDNVQRIKTVINSFDLKILEEKGYLVLNDSTKTADEKIEDLNTLISQISESNIAKIKEKYDLDETLTKLSESIHNNDISGSKVIIEEIMSQAISILYPEQNK